jgi:DNA replication protein DnaC
MKRDKSQATSTLQDTINLAEALNLKSVTQYLPEILNRAQQQNISYTQLVSEIFKKELDTRLEKRVVRSLKRSKVGTVEDLETFDFCIRPQLHQHIIKELCECRFVEEKRNVLCLGKPGLGKTRIAKTIARSACLAGYSVLFVNTAKMLEDIHGSKSDGTYSRAMQRYTKPALLVCDEFGYEPFDNNANKYLFRLVSARHRTGSIILTSNTGFSRWKNLFSTEAAAAATVDRLVDRATILRFTGNSCRKVDKVFGAKLED